MTTTPNSLPSTPRMPTQGPNCDTRKSVFWVNNVHCASCVAYVTGVLSEIPSVQDIDVSIFTHEVRVTHGSHAQPVDLAAALAQAAFEVHHVTTYDGRGSVVSDLDIPSWDTSGSTFFSTSRPSHYSIPSNSRERPQTSPEKRHIANCDACKAEAAARLVETSSLPEKSPHNAIWQDHHGEEKGLSEDSLEKTSGKYDSYSPCSSATSETKVESDASVALHIPPDIPEAPQSPKSSSDEYTAQISIGGMTCASCVNSITAAVQELDFVKDVTVNLLTNSATLVCTGPRGNVDLVTDQIEDIGFEAFLDQVSPVAKAPRPERPSDIYVSEIAITGMTCGSCVGTVTRGLEELSFVQNVAVNLLSHSGKVEFKGRDNLDQIVEKIEDLGYDAAVDSVHPLKQDNGQLDTVQARTIAIRVDGMFCHHCPEKVLNSLQLLPGVTVEETLSEKSPVLKISYTPHPPSLTVRSILASIDEANSSFRASIYHPPSMEDRSRAMQLRERRRLLTRLLFVLAAAIPTFIVGIVFMSLVSSEDPIRRYLEQTLWSGSVTRLEWALFITTTPVMFYGADVFHIRAIKEIHALWRPGSRVPILRRFYRFGSMNLLISAGTAVAYFSSVAVLIVSAVGTNTGAHSTTYFDSVVFLTLFILAGRFLEAYSKAKAGDAVASLGKLRPSKALLVETQSMSEDAFDGPGSDQMTRISVDNLEVGDIVRVPHGASPPADGVVVSDSSYQFNESSLTGESRPVKKSAGDEVYTGSVNVGQPMHIRITGLSGSSMLDRIIAVVREGQSKRAPLERFADLLTSHFVPVITLIAISTFIIWLGLGHSGVLPGDYLDTAQGGWTFWSLEFAIAVFVVACPCGLALAAPTALFVGGGLAAKHGILVKGGGEAFQEASRLDAIVFDKTGTLTEGGSLKVSEHEVLTKDEKVLQVAWTLARKLEESSNHPIAQAVSAFCKTQPGVVVNSSDIQEISGQGMKGTFTVSHDDGEETQYEAAIGNERLLHSVLPAEADTYFVSNLLSKYQSAGKSTAILAMHRINPQLSKSSVFFPAIVFATSDTIRPEAVEIISQLNKRHVEVYMCTGDNQTTAHAVADMLGIPRSNVMANVLPAEKASFVRQVQDGSVKTTSTEGAEASQTRNATRPIVAFVGDGVNDSPALAAADVSIAMASGSDVAINSAGFILLNSDLSTILQLVLLSRRVFNRVRMNFGWALIYNLCLVPVAAGVLYPIVTGHHEKVIGGETVTVNEHWRLSPVWAALAMALSSISVVTSSLALRVDVGSIKKVFGRR